MPKKNIPVPSDFARPTPGTYLKKNEGEKKKFDASAKKKSTRDPYARKKVDNKIAGYGDRKKANRDDAGRSFTSDKMAPSQARLNNPFRAPNKKIETLNAEPKQEQMPLNKYIAHCGICSRREAIEPIKEGKVQVNGTITKEPGYKINEKDEVHLEGKKIVPQRNLVYYLLNKPKDFITTTDDPEGRKTVMDLFKNVTDARIFPVGRLDRNTTGLLLMTNDGELTQKLSHPKNNIRKVYQVGLNKPLTKNDLELITQGLILEDGLAVVDQVAFIDPKDKTQIGIEIHSGRNRIVRRIFEHLQYEVKTLDRVMYAGLTKKNIPRGKFRVLEPKEVIFLKHFKG